MHWPTRASCPKHHTLHTLIQLSTNARLETWDQVSPSLLSFITEIKRECVVCMQVTILGRDQLSMGCPSTA
jgi:hypothetical protein